MNGKRSFSRGDLSREAVQFERDTQVGHGGIPRVRIRGCRSVVSQRAFADEQVARLYLGLKAGGAAHADKGSNADSREFLDRNRCGRAAHSSGGRRDFFAFVHSGHGAVLSLVRDFGDIGEEFRNQWNAERIAGQQRDGRNFSRSDADMKLSFAKADGTFVDEAFICSDPSFLILLIFPIALHSLDLARH